MKFLETQEKLLGADLTGVTQVHDILCILIYFNDMLIRLIKIKMVSFV